MINTDKIARLVSKVGVLEEKIENMQAERDGYVDQINQELGLSAGQASDGGRKTTPARQRVKVEGKLGDRILGYLQSNGGQSLHKLASMFNVEPKQVGLAMMHLGKAGLAMIDQSGDNVMYYATKPIINPESNTTSTPAS